MSSPGDAPKSSLERSLSAKLNSRRAKSLFRQLTVTSPSAADFSSNDFLSLSTSQILREAFIAELQSTKNFAIGSGGSRLLDGNSKYADELEKEIAEFHKAEAALLWNSGFDANSGLFACLPQPEDVIIHDELIHASVHDGMKLSRASKRLAFLHNSVEDLRGILQSLVAESNSLRDGKSSVFVAVESVYSMDGDIAPLKEIVDLLEEVLPKGNGHIVIDEAHGTGVLGPKGSGLVCELGLEKKVLARLHTFGKSLACSGAVVLCSPLVRSYLINYARPLIYTTFMPFPSLVAIKASYSLLKSGQTEPLAERLRSLTLYFHDSLMNVTSTSNLDSGILHVSKDCPKSPIFSLQTDHPRSLAKYCQDVGFVVRAVVPPTVPTRRVRVCLHAGNSFSQIDGLVKRIREWLVMAQDSDVNQQSSQSSIKSML